MGFKLMRFHCFCHALRYVAGSYLLAIFTAATVAAELDPYEARVIVARAQVRSGPGEQFYPSDTLAESETVEVYREHAGGWLAIRPPKNSFSWVCGRYLKLRDNGLAEVDAQGVDSRIGSRFGNQRNAVQIQLRKGEVVEILGEAEEGGDTWYKIAPPAGEFRWIHATNVKRVAASVTADSDEPAVVVASATNADDSSNPTNQPRTEPIAAPAAVNTAPPADDWRAALGRSTSAAPEIPSLIPAPSVPQSQEVVQVPEPPAPPVQPLTTSDPTAPAADELARRLTDIELRLSRMVTAPPDRWNTERLKRDTQELLTQAQTAAERDAVNAMLAKLDQFDVIARRHQPTAGSVGHGAGSEEQGAMSAHTGPLAATPGFTPPDTRHPTPDTSKYDAVGILRPVVSKRPGAPQFALVDDRGQVISFVTPTPDLNLQPYLGHRVGVVGSRGFIPEFQRAHVTAGRVAPLGERLVR
jgi:uncharacterized protein YgiM (DUF1202 family)